MSNNNDELWLECKTPGANSRLYYINKATGKVSWTKPSSSNIQSATSKSQQIIQMKKRRKPHHRKQNYVGEHYVAL